MSSKRRKPMVEANIDHTQESADKKADKWIKRNTRKGGKPDTFRHESRGSSADCLPHAKGYNDPTWYMKNKELARDGASLYFGWPYGNKQNINGTDFGIPTVMRLDYQPVFGHATSATDALNVSVRAIYAFIRHANSGSKNYEAADYGVYLFAACEALSAIKLLERDYGVMNTYLALNRAVPNHVMVALGYNLNGLILTGAELAQFRYGINRLLNKFKCIVIPKGFSYLARRIWLNSNVFKEDKDTDRTQLYVFCPRNFVLYEPTFITEGGCLTYQSIPTNSLIQRLNAVEELLDAIIEDEDMAIMAGDTLKAYGAENCVTIDSMLPEDYKCFPIYDEEALLQIRHAQLIDYAKDIDDEMFCTNTDYITYDSGSQGWVALGQKDGILISYLRYQDNSGTPVTISTSTDGFTGSYNVLTFPWEGPNAADVLMASRFMQVVECTSVVGSPTQVGLRCLIHGSEIIVGIHTFGPVSGNVLDLVDMTVWGSSGDDFQVMSTLSNFDYHPLLKGTVYFSVTNNNNSGPITLIFGDLDTTTVVDSTTLDRLHETCFMSMYIPDSGSYLL